MNYPYAKGTRVVARVVVTEDGTGQGDPKIAPPEPGDHFAPDFVHAMPGELGTVGGVDDGTPTVRFDRHNTATIVGDHEIRPLEEP